MNTNVWAVIRREYLQRIRSKWFIISTIGAPLFMAAVMVIPAFFAERGERAQRVIKVVDHTGVLYERVLPQLEAAEYTVSREPATSGVEESLAQEAGEGEIGGFLVLDEETLSAGRAVLHANSRPSLIRRATMQNAIARSALEYLLEEEGVDATALLAGGSLDIEVLSTEGAGLNEPDFLVAYIGAFFLYMVILLYAVSVMRATLEEKTSRVVEVVISSMKPWHLMLGKIIGVGAVGLTQVSIWILTGVLMFTSGLSALAAAQPELLDVAVIRGFLPEIWLVLLLGGFFVFGFFMYAGLYAAVGAMCSTDEEAQQAQAPVIMLIIVPIVFILQVIRTPGSALAIGLSLFPFFSPILMYARAAGGGAPGWQIALSFVLMGLTIVAVAWVAGRIYKVGILMAGKRPTLPELWRWVRESG